MDSTKKSSSTKLLEEDIPTDFKVLWLNTTLKFVKNDKLSLFKYPEMPANRIKFLKVMITTSNTNGLFSPLWEALKMMSLKYDFRMYVERTGSEQGHLFLEKIPKKEVVYNNGHVRHLSNPLSRESKPESCAISKGQKKRGKKKRNKKNFMQTVREQVDSISPLFVKNSLKSIFDFVEDEAQASFPFDSLSRVEAEFIYNFNGILKRKDAMQELFSPVCNMLWKKIHDTLQDATHFKLEISSINVVPDTCRRQITLFKTPKYNNKKTEEINESTDSDIENESPPNMERDVSDVNRLKLLQSIENCVKKDSTHQSAHINSGNMLLASKNLLNEPTNSREFELNNTKPVTNTKEPTIDKKSATNKEPATNKEIATNRKPALTSNPVLDIESVIDNIDSQISKLEINSNKVPTVEKTVVGRKRSKTIQVPTVSSALNEMMNTSRLPQPKVKLIEGLSKPLESEKGLRMMRCMGWDGGALGTREGGITEPIMPALHLTAKAGLGHVGTHKVVKAKNSQEFRVHILENILNLLNNGSTELVIDFCDQLNKKEINFLGNVGRALKSGKRIGVSTKSEEKLDKKISAFLSSKRDLMVDVQVVNKRQVKLEKKSILNVHNQTKQKQSAFVLEKHLENTNSLPNAGKEKTNKTVRGEPAYLSDEEILSLLDLKEQVKISKKSMNKLKIRLFIIKSFLDFFKSDSDNVTLNCKLSSPMRKYIHGLCSAINSRTEHKFRFSIETFVWLDIVQFLKGRDLYLMVQVDSRSFGLNKISKSSPNFTNYENHEESSGSSDSSFSSVQSSKDSEEQKNQQSDVENIFYFGNNINNVSNNLSENSKFKIDDSTNSSVINVRIIQRIAKPMTIDTVKEIQTRISNAIVSPPFPMLKCHGVKSDSLIYSCYDKNSFEFLKEVLKDFQIVEYEISSLFKMAATFKSNASLSKVLHWLQLYHNLNVNNWDILSTSSNSNLSFTVSMDFDSFQYICMKKFTLLTGVDELTFEIII